MEGRVLLHKSAVFYCVRKSAVFYYVENRAYVSKIIPISRDNDLSISLKSTAMFAQDTIARFSGHFLSKSSLTSKPLRLCHKA